MQILNPSPGSPSSASFGSFVPWNAISPVGAQCRPSFVSMSVATKSSTFLGSRMNALMPRCFRSGSVMT